MKDNQHIVTAFDDDLSELNTSLQNLGKMAITQFELSIDALATQHQNTLDKIIKYDVNLDDLEAAFEGSSPNLARCELVRRSLSGGLLCSAYLFPIASA